MICKDCHNFYVDDYRYLKGHCMLNRSEKNFESMACDCFESMACDCFESEEDAQNYAGDNNNSDNMRNIGDDLMDQ